MSVIPQCNIGGSGHSTVLEVIVNDKELAVLKYNETSLMEVEHSALQIISGIPSALTLLGSDVQNNMLRLSPRCTPLFTSFSNTGISLIPQLTTVVNLLRHAHSQCLFHGDICPQHLMVHQECIYLIDWDHSIRGKLPNQFAGLFASPRTLQTLEDSEFEDALVYTAADDLISLVQTTHALVTVREPPGSIREALNHWGKVRDVEAWGVWYDFAESLQYDKLGEALSTVLPLWPLQTIGSELYSSPGRVTRVSRSLMPVKRTGDDTSPDTSPESSPETSPAVGEAGREEAGIEHMVACLHLQSTRKAVLTNTESESSIGK